MPNICFSLYGFKLECLPLANLTGMLEDAIPDDLFLLAGKKWECCYSTMATLIVGNVKIAVSCKGKSGVNAQNE